MMRSASKAFDCNRKLIELLVIGSTLWLGPGSEILIKSFIDFLSAFLNCFQGTIRVVAEFQVSTS
jgi:hypothetical protein